MPLNHRKVQGILAGRPLTVHSYIGSCVLLSYAAFACRRGRLSMLTRQINLQIIKTSATYCEDLQGNKELAKFTLILVCAARAERCQGYLVHRQHRGASESLIRHEAKSIYLNFSGQIFEPQDFTINTKQPSHHYRVAQHQCLQALTHP